MRAIPCRSLPDPRLSFTIISADPDQNSVQILLRKIILIILILMMMMANMILCINDYDDVSAGPGQSSVQILDWVNEELLGRNRVTFDTQLSPASLKIRNVSEEDAGLYRSHITSV